MFPLFYFNVKTGDNMIKIKGVESGFTLIELLIVIAIIAIISSIAIVQYNNLKKSAYKNVVRSDMKNSLTMIVGFKSSYKNYPSDGSCGPGPMSCDLTDGVHTIPNGIVVSRGVTIEWSVNDGGRCSDGSDKLIVRGRHQELTGWEASFESCNYRFTGF